jgi:hypothetical protein
MYVHRATRIWPILIPLPSSLCNVIYIQKDIVRGNAYMENQQTYSRDDIYIYQYLGLLRRIGISTTDEELDLHPLYLIPKLHKCPYQPCSISKCCPRNMQTINMHYINDKKCAISYSRRGVNQLWILTKCNDIQARPPHAIILTYFPPQFFKYLEVSAQSMTLTNKGRSRSEKDHSF